MTTLYTWQFRSNLEHGDLSYRDYLHTDITFRAFSTREAALADAKCALDTDLNGDPEDIRVLTKWTLVDDAGKLYADGGAWYEIDDGEEGRVVIHTINVNVLI